MTERPPATAPSAVFLNRFYWPDVAATGQMLTDLAEDLVAQGWDVTVVTGGGDYGGGRTVLPREEIRAGVRILRVRGTRFGRHRLLGRLLDYVSYLGGATMRVLRLGRRDMVVAMSDPPFLSAVAVIAARLTGARSVYWVQDLFPQIAAKLGVMTERSLAYRVSDRVARALNRRCDLVIALGPRMAESLVAAGARAERTRWVHNWADASAIRPIDATDNPFVRMHDLAGRFVVLYSGNAGRAHPFDAVLHAARALTADHEKIFMFIGGGKRFPELRAAAERENLRNVRFLEYLPREQLCFSLSAASVSLVTEDPQVEGLLVPSKTYGILASGRPLLFVGSPNSDVARIVGENDCGVVVSPQDGEGLARAIVALRNDPERLARMGANARRAAESMYDRRRATERWAELALAAAGKRRSCAASEHAMRPDT